MPKQSENPKDLLIQTPVSLLIEHFKIPEDQSHLEWSAIIRKAALLASLKVHPDKNPNRPEEAEIQFKSLNTTREIWIDMLTLKKKDFTLDKEQDLSTPTKLEEMKMFSAQLQQALPSTTHPIQSMIQTTLERTSRFIEYFSPEVSTTPDVSHPTHKSKDQTKSRSYEYEDNSTPENFIKNHTDNAKKISVLANSMNELIYTQEKNKKIENPKKIMAIKELLTTCRNYNMAVTANVAIHELKPAYDRMFQAFNHLREVAHQEQKLFHSSRVTTAVDKTAKELKEEPQSYASTRRGKNN